MIEPSVLIVMPYVPLPADFGGAVRLLHIIRALANHRPVIMLAPATRADFAQHDELARISDVTLVPVRWTARHSPGKSKRLLQLRSLLGHRSYLELASVNPTMQQIVDRLFLTRNIELVHYEFAQMALCRPSTPRPTVIDAHNVEQELLRRVAKESQSNVAAVLKAVEARKVRSLENRLWRGVDLVVATSDRDARTIHSAGAQETHVVPNGVDSASFARPVDYMRTRNEIVFSGALRHEPNADGIRWYLDHVHPRVLQELPDAHLTIVGADPPEWLVKRSSPQITVTGRVDDVRPHIWSAKCSIVPIHSGGGTRLKIVESFAAGTPVVSTSVGAEGIAATTSRDLVIADDAEGFARSVVHVLNDDAFATTLSDNAREIAVTLYDWSVVSLHLQTAHDRARELFIARATRERL